MSDQHKWVIRSKNIELVENMSLEGKILRMLLARNVLDRDEVAWIKTEKTPSEKIERFLEIFERKPDKAFYELIDILKSAEHYHIVNLLETQEHTVYSGKITVPVFLFLFLVCRNVTFFVIDFCWF